MFALRGWWLRCHQKRLVLAALAVTAVSGTFLWNRDAGASFERFHSCMDPDRLFFAPFHGEGGSDKTVAWERLPTRQASIQSILEAEKAFTSAEKLSSSGLHMLYGTFLVPFMQTHPHAKLLEVGSGCNQGYGPGSRMALWQKLLPTASLWEANVDSTCAAESGGQLLTVPKGQNEHLACTIKFFCCARPGNIDKKANTGFPKGKICRRQTALQKWLQTVGGDLHAVIHNQSPDQKIQAWTMFDALWPALRPGGMYFIEAFDDNGSGISSKLARWIDQMLIPSDTISQPMPSGLESIYCQPHACMIRKQVCRRDLAGSGNFVAHTVYNFEKSAREAPMQTDKTTTHRYQVMYGTFLLPFLQAFPQAKMLEIGLGCGMAAGTGASAKLWAKLFPSLDLWMGEYHASCVEHERKAGNLEGIKTVTGDQGDAATLQEWLITTGGNFDIIIDDGSHHNKHNKATFEGLWPALRPGGLYFLEDLQVGREPEYADGPATSEIMQAWVHQMLNPTGVPGRFPLPVGIESVYCQWEACVVRKAGGF